MRLTRNATGGHHEELLSSCHTRVEQHALEHALSCCKDGNRSVEPFARHVLAHAWLAQGDPRAIAEEALTHCLDIGARLVAVEAAVTLSMALRAEVGEAAGHHIEEILASAERLIAETGACNLAGFVLIERTALAELRGLPDEQRAHLHRARAAFARMGAEARCRAIENALDLH